jgi:tRNA (guanine-N(7)-)-methyltransferase subunit TRM82
MYEERERNGGGAPTPKAEEPNFELSLLLGHVSMLTALTLGKSDGRNYILTADRDEHVRVSRYIPQAHVIEGFCLGHREFIASMVIPAGREEVLVSGGGDTDLFVWDWKKGERLSTTSVLSLAQVVAPDTSKVAVSSLTTLAWPTDEGSLSYVLAICEE